MQKDSRNMLRKFADLSPNIVFVNVRGRIVYANKKFEEIMGYKREEFYSSKFDFFTLIAPEFKELVKTEFKKCLSGKEGCLFECTFITKDGKRIYAMLTARPMKNGGENGVLGVAIDITERKKAEEALRKSEEKFRKLFEGAMDAMFIADAETGLLLDCNNAACELVGRDKSEIIGKHQRILHPPQEIEGEFSRTFTIHREEKEGKILETKIITKKGEIRDVAVKASVIELEGRKVLYGIFRDITENKKLIEALRHEQDLLQALMDNVPDSIYFKDTESRFTRVNKAQAQLIGVKDAGEAIGKTDHDYFTKEHATDAYADEQKIVKNGVPLISKIERVRGADGQFYWYSATKVPIKDKNGQVTGIVGISRNITELKEMQDALQASEERFRLLAENAQDLIYRFQFKPEPKFEYVSPSSTGITGYTPEEFYADPMLIFKVVHSDDRPLIERIVNAPKQQVSNVTMRWKRKDGAVIWVEQKLKHIYDKEGELIVIEGIARDITRRKEMEEELRKYTEHLEELVEERTKRLQEAERLAVIGETTAMVGHDLRNPLQVIVGLSYLAKKKVDTSSLTPTERDELKRLLVKMDEQTAYMNKIVSDLQDYARPLKPELTEASLLHLINDVLSTVKIPKKIKVSTLIPDDFPRIMIDPTLIKRVLTNLVLNALQSMPDEGKLTIEANRTEENVIIKVKDTGVGIPEENLPKLFQPLFTTKPKGLGLGLAVCKRMIEAHNGNITVKSQTEKGTTFIINLPLKRKLDKLIRNTPTMEINLETPKNQYS